jgi:hypothetical protein
MTIGHARNLSRVWTWGPQCRNGMPAGLAALSRGFDGGFKCDTWCPQVGMFEQCGGRSSLAGVNAPDPTYCW